MASTAELKAGTAESMCGHTLGGTDEKVLYSCGRQLGEQWQTGAAESKSQSWHL